MILPSPRSPPGLAPPPTPIPPPFPPSSPLPKEPVAQDEWEGGWSVDGLGDFPGNVSF